MKATLRGVFIVAFATAVATAFLGWWTVPVVGLGWALQRPVRHPVIEASIGAALGWGSLLGLAATRGDVGRVAERVGAVVQLPAGWFIAVTLAFAALLAGAAATVGREVRRL